MACKYLEKCPFEIKGTICKVGYGHSLCTCFIKLEAEDAQRRESNIYWNNVCTIADRQRKKGIEEYGQGIEDNPESICKRLEYIEEELVDALMYIEWAKAYITDRTEIRSEN